MAPGENEIVCELEVIDAGEFSSQLHLFVDDHGTREIVFAVHGTAIGQTASAKSAARSRARSKRSSAAQEPRTK